MLSRSAEPDSPQERDATLAGGGEVGALMRAIEWDATPLGPPEQWPDGLKASVRIMLTSPRPTFVWWGRDFIHLYNDAFKSILHDKHPASLGRPAAEVWPEIWKRLGPRIESALANNEGLQNEVPVLAGDSPEETFLSFSFSPLPGDPGGVFGTCSDETRRMIGERQAGLLRELAAAAAEAETEAEACIAFGRALQINPRDLPLAMIYLRDPDSGRLSLAAAAGIAPGHAAAPDRAALDSDSPWPFADVIQTRRLCLVSDLSKRFRSLPPGVGNRPLRQAVLVPITIENRLGVLVAGLSPLRRFDDDYRGFVESIAVQIGANLESIRAAANAGGESAGSKLAAPPSEPPAFVRLRHEASSALRESERRYRQLVQALPAAVYTTDAEGRITLYNQAAAILWGRAPEIGKERWTGAWRMYQVDGSPLRADECPLAVSIKLRRPDSGREMIIEREDGSRRHVLSHPQPIYDLTGKLTGAVNMLVDLTEYRLAENELRKREEWLRQATRTGKVGVWDWDIAANHVTWTDSLYAIHGVSHETMSATVEGFYELVHPDDRAHVADAIKNTLENDKPYEVEFRAIRPNGDVIWLFTNGVIIREAGKAVRMFGVTMDITDRKRTTESLRKQSDRIRLLWQTAAVLLTMDDPDSMLRGLFDRIARQFGLDVCLNYMVTEDGDALRLESCVGIPIEAGKAVSRLELGQGIPGAVAVSRVPMVESFIQQSDDATTSHARSLGIRAYVCTPMLVGSRLLGTLSFGSRSRDDFEPDEIGFLRTIGRYVTVAYERLRLLRELKTADQRKDEFLATLAHELRNPLAPFRNGLDILRMSENHGDAAREALGMMERQFDQMVRLIDDLLDVSRISRGKVQLRMEQIEIATLIRSAVESSRPAIAESGNELQVHQPADEILVEGDFLRLSQVLTNLLNNAAKYTPRGGRIELAVHGDCDWVTISVRDNGMGISAQVLPKIFDLFMQADRSLEKSQGGLGIGLTIVKRLVEMHGGSVEARSAGPGLGSEFIVRLPAASSYAKPTPADEDYVDRLPNCRILVVDDNRDSARSMAMLLEMDGHETKTAFDGLEAIDAAATFRPDLILMDIGMPNLNGHEACRRIREQPWGQEMVIVALTGWGQDEDRRDSQDVGFNHHLVKPIKISTIQSLLPK